MFICQKCEPEYEHCEGDTLGLCEKHEPEAPASEPQQPDKNQTRWHQPGVTLVQGRLFDDPPWLSH